MLVLLRLKKYIAKERYLSKRNTDKNRSILLEINKVIVFYVFVYKYYYYRLVSNKLQIELIGHHQNNRLFLNKIHIKYYNSYIAFIPVAGKCLSIEVRTKMKSKHYECKEEHSLESLYKTIDKDFVL